MRVFKNKWFVRFAEKAGITDDDLRKAALEIEAGTVDANYGGDVYKKRIARKGGGKRSGYRSIVFFRRGEKMFFVYGFAKSSRDNISEKEERQLKKESRKYLGYSDEALTTLKKAGQITEI
ncbi:MAG: type II toxin-antitoxin system RelE/ParE family toxin [Spirochaetaceae bacterium]|jgi:hypothetical protein|nr:type II toxin-antitoxin system RelE/ParE family toxin [Spirochaetaceae bacterium]